MAAWVAFAALPAAAFTGGEQPSLLVSETVFGDAAAHADSLMFDDGTTNIGLKPGGGTATISGIPADADTVRAFVFWAGSVDPIFGVDRDIDLQLPGGAFFNNLSVDFALPGEVLSPLNRCTTLTIDGTPFFSCRREITFVVDALGTGAQNGGYTVSDVDARPGDCLADPTLCQAMFAGFAVVVYWESPTETVRRELLMYDAFYGVDERNAAGFETGISPLFNLGGFTVGTDAEVRMTIFSFEGDNELGNPPQDSLPQADFRYCPSCPDYLELSGSGGTRRLSGPGNPEGNLFNSTITGQPPTPGVDLDTFNLGPGGLGIMNTGDTSVLMEFGSGDGLPGNGNPLAPFPDQGGSGELVILGMTLLTLDTFSPRLIGSNTTKSVLQSTAPPGGTLNYSLTIENDGSATANNVRVRDLLPAGVTYVLSSTTNTCGVNSADVGGTSPILTGTGLNIGNLAIGAQCQIQFDVTVNNVPDGTVLTNFFTLNADNHDPATIGPATTTVQSPQLGTPTKTVQVLGGGDPIGGAPLIYTLRITNTGTDAALGLTLLDTLDADTTFVSMISTPAGSMDNSAGGNIDVSNINVAADSFVEIVFAAEINAGVGAGTLISNQATVDGPGVPVPLLTDDPAQPGPLDPTTLTVISSIDLTTSTKTVLDVNGPLTIPGDLLEYTITITQSGSQPINVTISDDLPAFVTACNVTQVPAGGFAFCNPGGANGTGRIDGTVPVPAGSSVTLRFTVTLVGTVPDGSLITNQATLTPLQDPAQLVAVTSGTLEVFARPVFTTSTKSVQDLNGGDLRPGDIVRYTIDVENSGPIGAANLVVTDPLDSDLAIVTIGQGGALAGGVISWPVGNLGPGGMTTLIFDATVPSGTPNGTLIDNAATVAADAPADPFTTANVQLVVVATPLLSMTKVVADLNGGFFEPGDTVRYTLVLQNTGDGAATDVEIRDPIDPRFASVSLIGGGQQQGNEIVFNAISHPALGSLGPGLNQTLEFEATLLASIVNGTIVSNQAFATAIEILTPVASDVDPGNGTPEEPTTFPVSSQAVLTHSKTFIDENGAPLLPGETVIFSLLLTNTGNAPATNVVVTDPLDVRLTFVDSASGGTAAGNVVTFSAASTPSLASIEPGAPVLLTFRAQVAFPLPNGTLLLNQASAASPVIATVASDDPTTAPFGDPTALLIESRPILEGLTKAVIDLDGNGIFEPGDRVRYEMSVTNTGSENAFNLVATDVVPASLTNIVAGAGGQLAGGTLTWNAATTAGFAGLAPGQTAVFSFEADIVRPAADFLLVSNQVTLVADGVVAVLSDDPATGIDNDATDFIVRSSPRLVVEKRVSDSNGLPVEPGDTLNYELRVRNVGDRAAVNVVVDDPAPAQLINLIAQDGGVVAGNNLQWTAAGNAALANLAIDTEIVLRFSADVVSPLANGSFVDNQASSNVAEAGIAGAPWLSDDPLTPAPLDPTRVQVVSAADLSVSTLESFSEGGAVIATIRPGELIRYVLVVENAGNAPGVNVIVTVPLPITLNAEAAPGGSIVGQTVTFTSAGIPQLAQLDPGQQVTLSIDARVAFPLADGLLIDVQGTLGAQGLVNPFVTNDPSTAALSDPTQVTVISEATLIGSKTFLDINGSPPEPLDNIQYRIVVTNTGDATALGVVVTDPLPSDVSFVSSSSGGVQLGGNIVFSAATTPSLVSVPPNTPVELFFTVIIDAGLANGTQISNQAQLQVGGGAIVLSDDPTVGGLADPTRFFVETVPALTVTKAITSPGGSVLAPSDPIEYTLTVLSSGSATVTASILIDALPLGLDNVVGPNYDPGTRTFTLPLPDLAPQQSVSFSFTATIGAALPNGTQIINQAQVNSPQIGLVLSDDPNTAAAGDATIVLVEAFPELGTSTKTVLDENGGSVLPGDILRYDIAIINSGNGQAREVQITDVLDGTRLEVVEILNGGTQNGDTLLWTQSGNAALTEIAAQSQVTVSVRVRVRTSVADGEVISNQASILARDLPAEVRTDDPSTAPLDDATNVTVQAPVITMTKTFTDGNGAPLNPGDPVSYSIVVANGGSGAASGVVVNDLLPIRLIDATAVGGVIDGGLATWNVGSLAANAQVTLELTGTVNPLALGGELLTNQAELDAAEILLPVLSDDPTSPPTPDATIRTIEGVESYAGSVELLDPETLLPIVTAVMPNQRVAVRVTMTHNGTQAGQGVVMRVPFIPSQFVLDESPDGIQNPDGTEMRWNASNRPELAVVLPGTTLTFDAVGTIQTPIPDGITINVEGRVSSALSDGQSWVLGPASMLVSSKPDLSASTKEVTDENGGVVEPGDLLTYRMTVINAGGAEAQEVLVIDPAPPGTVFMPGSIELSGVSVADNGSSPLANGFLIGDVSAGRSVIVSFKVRVDTSAVRGLTISNQAVFRPENGEDAVSDNPRTPLVIGDATSVVVGGGPLLVAQKRASTTTVAPGGIVTFAIAVENGGSDLTRDIVINDPLLAPAVYVPGSLRIDGLPVTDEADADEGAFISTPQPAIEVRRDLLEAGEGVLVTFDVVAESAPALQNQATVTATGLLPLLTDADAAVPGAQILYVPVSGAAGEALVLDQNATQLRDANGGLLEPGDPMLSTTVIRNRASVPIIVSAATFNISALIDVDAAALADVGFQWNDATRVVSLAPGNERLLAPGAAASFQFPVSVNGQAPLGEVVRVLAEAVIGTEDGAQALAGEVGTASLTVGLLEGTGALTGVVYFDADERNNTFDIATDGRAKAFQVLAFRAGIENGDPIRTATTDDRGRYQLRPLPAGPYVVEVRSPTGTVFVRYASTALVNGQVRDEDLRIDPSGVLYRSGNFQPQRGGRVFLYVDDGDGDLNNDVLVSEIDLLPGQQGQVTPRQGLYRFDPLAGSYRIGVELNDPLLSFPSAMVLANRSVGEVHPLGSVAMPAPDGRVVAHAEPDAALDSTYFLRFNLAPELPPVLNNHIPLDSLRDSLRISKTANRKRLSIGDLVGYTVRIENPSGGEVLLAGGGVEFVDTLPAGFRLVPDAWRIDRIETDGAGQQRRRIVPAVASNGGRALTFGAFALRANSAYELRYSVVVGPGAVMGAAENIARLRAVQGGVPLTNTAVARVRVVPDPIFDLGTLRAKVYCDQNGDGWQDKGDLPLPGVRVYLDTGYYADADLSGKLHFTGIPPGMHLAKLDTRTLPPGTTMVEDERANFYISAGLPAQVSFPAHCSFTTLNQPSIALNEAAYEIASPPTPSRTVRIAGALALQSITLDDEEMGGVRADLGLALEGQKVRYGRADGPNVTGINEGVLRERLAFLPRARTERRVLAWKLTVQRELLTGVGQEEGTQTNAARDPEEEPGLAMAGENAGLLDGGTPGVGGDGDGVDGGAVARLSRRRVVSVLAGGRRTSRAADGDGDGGVESDAGQPGLPATFQGSLADGGDEGHLASSSGGWEVSPVYVFAGEGALPTRIVWDGKDENGASVLEAGARYGAVLSVVVDGGDEAFSGTRPFGVAWGTPSVDPSAAEAGFETSIDGSAGKIFDRKGEPTKRTIAWLQELAPRLLASEGRVELHVHVDNQTDGAATALTARQAAAALATLEASGLPSERLQPVGEGDGKPIKPNFRARDRRANRRLEIHLVADKPEWPSVPPLSWPAQLLVNGEPVPLSNDDVEYALEREMKIGAPLTIDVRGNGLGRFRITRVVEQTPFAAAPGQEGVDEQPTLLDGDITDGNVLWGARKAPLDLLAARLVPNARTREGAALMTLPSGEANLELKTVTGSEREWAKWTVRIMKPLGQATAGGDAARSLSRTGIGQATSSGLATSNDANASADGGAASDAGHVDADNADGGAGQVAPLPVVEDPVRLVRELSGSGAPPETVRWDGVGTSGVFLPSVGQTYRARLILEAVGGDIAISPDLDIFVGTENARAETNKVLLSLPDAATSRGRLKRATRKALKKLVKRLPPGGKLRVEAHENRGSRLSHRTKSQSIADAARAELIKAGLPAERALALGLGSDQPVVPAVNSRARRKNRRLVISLVVPEVGGAAAGADRPLRVLANGRALEVDNTSFRGEVPASSSGEVALLIRTVQGARAVMRLKPETLAMWQGRPATVDQALAEEIASRQAALIDAIFVDVVTVGSDGGPALEPTSVVAESSVQPADGGVLMDSGTASESMVDGGRDRPASDGGNSAGDGGNGQPRGGRARNLVGDAASDGRASRADAGPGQGRETALGSDAGSEDASPFYAEGPVPFDGEGPAPAWWPALMDVPAARLSVTLPPDGDRMTTDKFVVRGETDPSNQILVMGTPVEVDPISGRFEHMVKLVNGRNELVVEAIDVMGNRGRVRRLIQVDTHGWFVLLLADTAIGMEGAKLDERGPTSSISGPFGQAFIYGRGVAYVKGTFQGPYVFRDYDLTLHVDTRRWIQEAFVRDVFDPDTLYPVYGDSSTEVQDATASYPLYFRLQADASSILIGNVRTEMEGGDLFRFNRTRYGAMLHFDRGWSGGIGIERDPKKAVLAPAKDPWRTEVKAFVAGGADASRHARVELQGTGSSMYFMRHEDIVEGTERVFIIVRDAVTATEIARRGMIRNQDYTMRYPEGRLVLKEPVPAFADTSFMLNQNLGQVQAGHRVYVEVEYDHNADEPFQALTAGAQVKQRFFGHAEVGAAYAYEGRYDTPFADGYHLAGVHAKAWLDEGTFIKAELAFSRSVDAGNFVSNDGGLSYRSLGQSLDQGPARYGRVVFPEQRQGWALKLEGQAALGELIGRKDKDLLGRAYFQRQSPGFFAGSNIVEQGQWKGGAEGRWVVSDNDRLQLRADYIWSEIPEIPQVSEVRNLHRALATLRYERRLPWNVVAAAEYGAGFTYDSATFGSSNTANPFLYLTNIGALGLDWKLLDKLTLGVKQEVILTGDGTFLGAEFIGMEGPGKQLQTWNDHFVTRITAKYDLTERLAITGSEAVRWNGENQTSIGLSWKVNDTSRVYANERLGFSRQGMTNTTVIGGETSPVSGSRTYAEYQLTSGFAGQQSRGVAGVVSRFKLPFGLALNFGYERVQVLGGNVAPTAAGAVPPGAFTDGTFAAAPGANNGGNYIYGAGSRDAGSLGIEYRRGGIIFSQRLELRYDNFAEDRGGSDRLWALSMTNLNWVITPELAVLARYNIALAYDLNLATRETHLEEGSLGVSYRPVTHDWVSVWAKLQRRVEVRPISLKEGRLDSYMVHAASVEPIVELPWKLQLVFKGALKHASQAIDDLDPANAFTFLGIGRLNWHALGTVRSLGINPYVPGEIDLGVEYRALWGITSATVEHGFLVEAQYAPLPYFRLGIGWNFTRFTDNVLLRNQQDNSGFFIRAVGQY